MVAIGGNDGVDGNNLGSHDLRAGTQLAVAPLSRDGAELYMVPTPQGGLPAEASPTSSAGGGSTSLVLGAIASDGTPEPGVTAAAVSETVAIPEPTVVAPVGDAVERWRPLVASIFPAFAVDTVLAVMWCESRGDPNATGHAGEMGLLQIHPRWHYDATYDPEGNLKAGYRISSGGTDWSAWTCRP